MKVLFFWEPGRGITLEDRCNPYAGLLARALEQRGVYLDAGEYDFERAWLEQHREEFAVLHLNWLHAFYRTEDLETTVERYARFAENLSFARRLGYRIVWTLHNLYPHERPFPHVDHLARLLVCRLAHAAIAHCEHAAGRLRRLFYREGEVHVIPHGHFIDVYPNEISRQEAREKLGIPAGTFVYLFFGNARNYKGIEHLIDAFCRTGGEARLVLMMRQSFGSAYTEELKRLAAPDGRILVFTSEYFPKDDFQIYLNGADVTVLPFSEVLTSGSAITSLSFGRPVILPRLGCLPELIDESMGVLYDPREAQGLEKALVEIREKDLEAAGRAAYERAKSLEWDGIAARVAEVYRG